MPSTGNILDVAPQQDSTFLPLASNGAIGFKVEEDGSKQAQLTTGTFGVTQSPWNVPNRPACSPSLDVAERVTGNAPVTDGLQVGDEGVSNCGELPLGADAAGTDALGRRLATHPLRNEQLADSQASTPLYLLASEIVDVVTKGYEQ